MFPRIILSANTTFVGAADYPLIIQREPNAADVLKNNDCECRFIPAGAPWFGVIWERTVGIVIAGLKKVSGKALVSREELVTISIELEATINDRPRIT